MTLRSDNTDDPLETKEREDTLEDRLSMLRTQVLSLSEKNEVLKNRLASLRLMQTAAEHKVAEEPVGKKRGDSLSKIGKWWPSERVSVFAVVAAGVLSILVVWMWPDRNKNGIDKDVNKELVAARERVSELEAELETRAENDPLGLAKELGAAINAKDEEIHRSRLGDLRMRKEIGGLRSELSSLAKEKDEKIARMGESVAWLKEKSREEISEIKLEKNKEIRTLRNKIEWLNTTKGVAIPGLIDALDHQDVSSRNIIAKTLTELTGKSFGTNQEKWRKWWRKNRLNFIRR